MQTLTRIEVWLNAIANALGSLLLAPARYMPGWLSATLVSLATSVLALVAFKYTSHQRAIKRSRSEIQANLLAVSLFKENVAVSLRAQARIMWGALRLASLSLVPMLVMLVPMTLLLGQLSLWYQARPLEVGEQAVLTLHLRGDANDPWPNVRLRESEGHRTSLGPVRLLSQRAVCWNLHGTRAGYHGLTFEVGQELVEKQLAVGAGLMRVSLQRPEWNWEDVLLNPAERPFPESSLVRSIEIQYPERTSWTSGTNSWVIYWFGVSMVGALVFRRALNVNL